MVILWVVLLLVLILPVWTAISARTEYDRNIDDQEQEKFLLEYRKK